MAAIPQPVLLGVPDEQCKQSTSWCHNKIGGLPDWMDSMPIKHPLCNLCQKQLYLVIQVYSPLIGSLHHRTLYVFTCTEKPCRQDNRSWSVLRMQKLAEKTQDTKLSEKPNAKENVDDWAEDADDWGSDDESQDMVLQAITAASPELSNGTDGAGQEEHSLPELECLSLSDSVDAMDADYSFIPHYMNVFAEPEAGEPETIEYEQRLLVEYAEREGLSAATSWDALLTSRMYDKESSSEEAYERGVPTHGNTTFLKFTKRVSRCPEQCVRYCWSGSPLLISCQDGLRSPDCQFCGAARVFECQLMPSLISFLQPAVHKGASLDFGTVLVYTCSKSCWIEEASPREECAVLQQDPDHEIIGHL